MRENTVFHAMRRAGLVALVVLLSAASGPSGNGKQVNLRFDARNVMTQFDSSTFLGADASKPKY